MKRLMTLLSALLLAPALAFAAGSKVPLDKAPVNLANKESLQRGARIFVNYCLNCHSAEYMRYSRLTDIGLTEDQIKDNLLFTSDKVGDLMKIGMTRTDGKAWFGASPPDLTVIARSRGADWLYTYLRSFYRDDKRPLGWNNLVFENVGMPHVLWDLQGEMVPVMKADGSGIERLVQAKPGVVSPAEYDAMMGDLVNYLVWMGEPVQMKRKQLGLFVLAFLGVLFVLAYYLKKEYWKDVH